MKYYYQVFLIILLGLQFSIDMLCQELNDKVLLLEYNEQLANSKILKDLSDKQIMIGQPIENPVFDGQRLDVFGFFKLTDSSKVILLAGGYAEEISLPFQYAVLKLDMLVNDSTAALRLNNKEFVSKPGEVVVDSVITEEERVSHYTIVYSLKNYGLIEKKRIFNEKDREIERNRMLEQIDSIK